MKTTRRIAVVGALAVVLGLVVIALEGGGVSRADRITANLVALGAIVIALVALAFVLYRQANG